MDHRQIIGSLGGLCFSIGAGAMWVGLNPTINHPELIQVAIGLWVLGVVAFAYLIFTRPNPGGAVHNVRSHYQTGGITAHTVNVDTRIKRTLNDDLRKGLREGVSRTLPVMVMAQNGDTESMAFAKEIHAFLRGEGFRVDGEGPGWHMFGNPPVFTVKAYPANGGTEWWVIVGPAQ